jgi:hypothetical protein
MHLSCASSEDRYMDDDSSSNINISNINTNRSGKGGRDKRWLETVALTVASGLPALELSGMFLSFFF